MKLSNSPITQHSFNGFSFYLKRDDLLHQHFSGNKARKFMSLLKGEYPNIEILVGYGSAQANSLYSLAALCSLKKWKLRYFVDHIPSYIKDTPSGNYRGALELGAEIIDLSQVRDRNKRHAAEYIRDTFSSDKRYLIVPEGGRSPLAEEGIKELAQEILHWQVFERAENLKIALPSGTGTTALYLQKHLYHAGIEVLTCACVGGEEYLREQFSMVDNNAPHPTILQSDSKHHFGRLYLEDYEIWQALTQQTQVEFDLLYDPLMWHCLQTWLTENQDTTLLYIHQGGLLGNESMEGRYRRSLASQKDTHRKHYTP